MVCDEIGGGVEDEPKSGTNEIARGQSAGPPRPCWLALALSDGLIRLQIVAAFPGVVLTTNLKKVPFRFSSSACQMSLAVLPVAIFL